MKLFFISLLLLLLASSASATTKYAIPGAGSTGCSNGATNYIPSSNTCGGAPGSGSTIYLTIQALINNLAAGDIGELRAGIYTESASSGTAIIVPQVPGTAINRITVRNYPGEQVTIRPPVGGCHDFIINDPTSFPNVPNAKFWTWSGLNGGTSFGILIDGVNCPVGLNYAEGANGFYIRSSDWIVEGIELVRIPYGGIVGAHTDTGGGTFVQADRQIWRRNKVHDGRNAPPAWQVPIYITGADVLVEDNEVYNAPPDSYGVAVCPSQGANAGCPNLIFRRNYIHNTPNSGMVVFSAINSQIYDNTFYNAGGAGIYLHYSDSAMVYNNSFYHVGYNTFVYPEWRSCIVVSWTSTNNIVRNNAVNDCFQYSIYNQDAANKNVFSNNGGLGTAINTSLLITANPLFADPTNGDFRLCTGVGQPHPSCTGVSPMIDQGTLTIKASAPTVVIPPSAYVGKTRDIGADESGVTPPPSQNLVLEIPCAGSSVSDTSGYGHNGTLIGGATYDGNGNCSLDGVNDYISVANAAEFNFTSGYTMEAWINPASLSMSPLFTKDGSGNYPWFMYAGFTGYCGTNVPLGGFWDGASGFYTACHGVPFSTGSWVHFAQTWDGTTIRLYVNGSPVTTGNGPPLMTTSTGNVRIGSDMFGNFFNGLIAGVKMYNYAISQSQVGADRDSTNPQVSLPPSPIVSTFGTGGSLTIGTGGSWTVGE